MFTKLLAYEIRSRYRTDVRSFGAFIAVIAVAAGIVAAGCRGSAAPPLSSPTPCVRSRRSPVRSRPWPTTGRPSTGSAATSR